MTKRIAIIDGNSLMHRAYHAVPPTMNAPDGTPTNAVFGFLAMFLKFVETERPDAVVCAFDFGKPAFRTQALEQYKAQRPPMDQELRVQFPLIENLLSSMKIPVVKIQGWEGDDILGTVSARNEALGYESLLVSGDRDIYQLASNLTKIVTTKKGITDVAIFGPEEIFEKYGVRPDQVTDYLGLKGDPSDNIPGVPGIGEKTAAKLLQQFGTMDGIYENLDQLKGKQLENIRDNKDAAYLSKTVATIMRDVDIDASLDTPLDLENIVFPAYTAQDIVPEFQKLGISSHLKHALRIAGEGPASPAEQSSPAIKIPFDEAIANALSSKNTIAMAASELNQSSPETIFACSLVKAAQTNLFESGIVLGVTKLAGVSQDSTKSEDITSGANASTEDFQSKSYIFEGDDVDAVLALLVGAACENRCTLVSLDTKEIIRRVYPDDSAQATSIADKDLLAARIFDCGVAAYVLDSSSAPYDIVAIAQQFANIDIPQPPSGRDFTDQERAVIDSLILAYSAPILRKALDSESAESAQVQTVDAISSQAKPQTADTPADADYGPAYVYENIDLPLVPVLLMMERTGSAIDKEKLKANGQATQIQIDGYRAQIIELAGEDFNVDSPKQLQHILFEVLELPHGKKTQRGYSTDASVLKELSKIHQLPDLILKYRELAKIKSTYIDALPRMCSGANQVDTQISLFSSNSNFDGRVHTRFNNTVTATGRLSSSDPNLQNIPVRTEFGRTIREAFIPLNPGDVFVSADYSQIELRLLAHLSGDEKLIDAFRSGADFHAATASHVFGVPIDEVTPELRSRSKAVNFGIVYGQQAFGLSQSLDIPFAEAKTMIEQYFLTYPQVRKYLDGVVKQAYETGYAETLFGRRRYIPEIKSSNANMRSFGERTAMNHPMQGSAADIVKIAMRQVQERLVSEGFSAKLMLQVHDELDFSCPVDELNALSTMVQDVMEHACELQVPLLVDVSSGANWAEAH